MTDRIIKVLENGRMVTRGISRRGKMAAIEIDRDETLPITVDWSAWLGSDTISSVTNETHGPTVASASNTTTQASFNLSASQDGYVEHRVTTAAGAVKELIILVNCDEPRRQYRRFV